MKKPKRVYASAAARAEKKCEQRASVRRMYEGLRKRKGAKR